MNDYLSRVNAGFFYLLVALVLGFITVMCVVPLVLMSLLCIVVPAAISQTSLLLIPSGALALGLGYLLFKKDKL